MKLQAVSNRQAAQQVQCTMKRPSELEKLGVRYGTLDEKMRPFIRIACEQARRRHESPDVFCEGSPGL